ncbi:Putative uncharacterized protein [Leuconostoc citreum]|nr:Putative uncharacterized protein [Leuconostoc citreum]
MVEGGYEVVRYADVLEVASENTDFKLLLDEMIDNFSSNGLNNDVENFLKKKAQPFHTMDMARTYLVFDKGFADICGYYSIAPKSITIKQKDWEKISTNARKKLNPLGYRDTKNDQNIPAILLGQLGKNFASAHQIDGDKLIEFAFSTIYDIANQIGGRYLYLEADDNNHLSSFYTRNGFSFLSYNGGSVYKTKNDQVMFIKKMSA